MDEKDAKLHGLEIHRREMSFLREYVNCINCAANYSASTNEPIFCQIFSIPIEPVATEANVHRAEACRHWVPRGLDRNKVVTPDHRHHYEDWE